jgi:hypothetical protein
VLLVLSSVAQYNDFAAGNQGAGRQPTEIDGSSSVHYAYFANAWFENTGGRLAYTGRGVAYWDRANPALDPYGQHAVRHAAALSYAEAIDPSWDTVSRVVAGEGQFAVDPFWAEKRIPKWLRYGVAAYVERFFRDAAVGEDGNPWWARDWAFANLRAAGGVAPTEGLFALALDANDPAGSGQRIQQAGLLVSFMLDGGCQPVAEAHAAFRAALAQKGADTAPAARSLEAALVAHREQLVAWLGE